MNFADRLVDMMRHRQSQVCLGLDPRIEWMPPSLLERYRGEGQEESGDDEAAACIEEFCKEIIGTVARHAVAVKVQAACFEQYGGPGMSAFRNVCVEAARYGLVVIADAKRGDIGISAEAYSAAFIGRPVGLTGNTPGLGADAVTVNPLFGSDGIEPFLKDCHAYGKGIFVLVKTSNPSSGELQDIVAAGKPYFEQVGAMVNRWGERLVGKHGYSSVGAVVGATDADSLMRVRRLLPRQILLLPGYGAQGAQARDIMGAFGMDGVGALVTASRSIIYASRDADYAAAAANAAAEMRQKVWNISH